MSSVHNNPKENRKIAVRIWTTDIGIRIVVRNSNVDNIPVFQNLDLIFDYNIWYSSKRNQHKGGTGALGDALKRSLGMGYASWTEGGWRNSQEDSFIVVDDRNKQQWDEPIILRFNGKEYTALLRLDIDNQTPEVKINQKNYDILLDNNNNTNNNNDTEVEVALPVRRELRDDLLIQLREYYKIYKIPKLRIDFSFEVEKR